jgi:hypothetical protein
MPPRSSPNWCPDEGRRPAPRHRHRPDLAPMTRSRLLPGGLDGRRMARQAGKRPGGGRKGRPRLDARPMSRRWSTSGMPGVPTSTTATTSARSPRTRGWRTPSPSRASCPPISARCSARASARSAGRPVGRSGGYLQDRRQAMKRAVPRQRPPAPLARHGAGAHRLPGPARPHLLDRARRPASRGADVQRDGGERRAEGARS